MHKAPLCLRISIDVIPDCPLVRAIFDVFDENREGFVGIFDQDILHIRPSTAEKAGGLRVRLISCLRGQRVTFGIVIGGAAAQL
mmetsp:Transcript_18164/g.41544  ORF Transcript_18164/g.41544 Transcript_18164/m.41544 type:complete len:84 (-) Transcript_18164:780-1031(-)